MDAVDTRTRYEVTEFWGKVPEGIAVGATIRDTWHGRTYCWDIIDMESGKSVGGWSGKALNRKAVTSITIKVG